MGREGSPLRDRVIFVEGAPRSGTTWLVTLLATHPEIAGVEAESHLFDFGVDRLFDNHEGRDPNLHGLQSYLDRDELVDLARDLCDGVLLAMRSHVSNGTEPPFVVEKTPSAARADGLDLVRKRDCYPDAWYIHIVREREATARSLMRAPWMPDRSYDACAALWDRTVGHIRSTIGGAARYREMTYESLRADPAAGCKEIFDWLGVADDEQALETVRVLSREQFSDLGAVAPAASVATGGRLAAAARTIVRRGRARIARDAGPEGPAPGSAVAFTFVRAMRERDAGTLGSLAGPSFELVYRAAGEDRSLRAEEAVAALVRIAEDTFTRRYVGEWWASAGGPGEWWTSAPGKPVWTILFSALAGDAKRVDFAIGLVLEDERVRRAVVIAAGPLGGRPVVNG